MHNPHSLYTLKVTLYFLAGIVLALGLVAGISLLTSASNVRNSLMPLQILGGDVIVNLVAPYLSGLIRGLGFVSLGVSIVLSLLLFALGRLLGRVASLEERLASLEAGQRPAGPAQKV